MALVPDTADRRHSPGLQRRRKREGRAQHLEALAAFHRVAHVVAAMTGIAFGEIIADPDGPGRNRQARLRQPRQHALYLTHVVCGVPASALARALGRPRQRVCAHCSAVEDARDNVAIDALLDEAERRLA